MTSSIATSDTITTLRRVRINNQGYDSSGNYWGVGMPLYHYELERPAVWEGYHRDSCRTQATEPFRTLGGNPICPDCGCPMRYEYQDISDHLRAYDRIDAKARLSAKYPNVRFAR
jgi:hypothetical protein